MDQNELSRTINQYEEYLQVEKGLSPGTLGIYKYAVEYYLTFCLEFREVIYLPKTWKLDDLGVREIEYFLREHLMKRQWAMNTMVTYVSAIRSFFNFLHVKGYFTKNPIQHFVLKRHVEEIVLSTIPESQMERLFQVPYEMNFVGIRNRLLLEFCYGLGITPTRLSQMKDVDMLPSSSEIQVHDGLWKKSYPIGEAAFSVLVLYMKEKKNLPVSSSKKSAFWVQADGVAMSRSQIIKMLKKELKHVAIPGLDVGLLRELSSIHFSDRGADIRSLQTLKNVKILRNLNHLKKESFQDLQKKFKQSHTREIQESSLREV